MFFLGRSGKGDVQPSRRIRLQGSMPRRTKHPQRLDLPSPLLDEGFHGGFSCFGAGTYRAEGGDRVKADLYSSLMA